MDIRKFLADTNINIVATPILLVPNDKISIRELQPQEAQEWDNFVKSSPESVPTQLSGWKQILAKSYGHRCIFLVARQYGQIRGVLPLVRINSLFTGKSLQSLPGAVCSDDPRVALKLIQSAQALAKDEKVDYLLLRDSRHSWVEAGLEVEEAHRGVRINLDVDSKIPWKGLRRSLRRQIKEARAKTELRVSLEPAGIKDFYRVFSDFNLQVGTPLFSYRFLQSVAQEFKKESLVAVTYLQGKPIAGFYCFILGNKLYGMWGGALPQYLDYKPTHLAYWALIEEGDQSMYTQFDLARSPYPSNPYDFKAQWSDSNYPIYQLYQVYHGKKPAIVQVSAIQASEGRTGRMFSLRRLWTKLPLPVARAVGPSIRRQIPFG